MSAAEEVRTHRVVELLLGRDDRLAGANEVRLPTGEEPARGDPNRVLPLPRRAVEAASGSCPTQARLHQPEHVPVELDHDRHDTRVGTVLEEAERAERLAVHDVEGLLALEADELGIRGALKRGMLPREPLELRRRVDEVPAGAVESRFRDSLRVACGDDLDVVAVP